MQVCRRIGSLLLIAVLACQFAILSGCETAEPDDSYLDRVPNVPPSTRSTEEPGSARVPMSPGQ